MHAMTDICNHTETVFQNAIKHWWETKQVNAAGIGISQGGTRDQNLRGDTMDGFRNAIIEHLTRIGIKEEDIFYGGQLTRLASNLPSYYRASKNWDIIVCKNSLYKRIQKPDLNPPLLLAAIEFKSQNESIGNNQNNRIEESIGNAHDFWASYENENFLRLTPRPWLGYLFVGKYAEGAESNVVEINQPHFPSDPAFMRKDRDNGEGKIRLKGVSYAERYRIFLNRMIAKKLYDGACFLVTHESIAQQIPNYRVLFPELSGSEFIDNLTRYVGAYYHD
jgi:hypothetical protein